MNIIAILLSVLPAFVAVLACLPGIKVGDGSSFFSKDYCRVLKGLFCIPVVYVHFPEYASTPVQNAIGSFAYVCVTGFFLMSAYGMSWSLDHKPGYLKHFWRNRLAALLVAYYLIRLCEFAVSQFTSDPMPLTRLPLVEGYVWVLLQYCILFFVVKIVQRRFFSGHDAAGDLVICIIVIISSLVAYFSGKEAMWSFERIGIVLGTLMYRYRDSFKKFMGWRNGMVALSCILLSAVFGVLYLKFKEYGFVGGYLLKVILAVSLLLTLFELTWRIQFNSRAASYMGEISYEVFLSHGIAITILGELAGIQSQFLIISAFALTVAFSALAHIASSYITDRLRYRY